MFEKLCAYLKEQGLKYDENKVLLQDDGDGVIYISKWEYEGFTKPTIAMLNMFTAEDLNKIFYAERRTAEYPTLEECVHCILDNDLEALQTKRAEVKAKYPKPSEG